jgi:hypothetical protein
MPEGSLDIEYTPKREVRTYRVSRGSLYTQTKQYDNEGNIEKEIWERDTIEGLIILDDAAYISKKKHRELNKLDLSDKTDFSELMKSAKSEGYTGYHGLIFILFQGKPYYSSEVIEIDPPFGEEYPIDA